MQDIEGQPLHSRDLAPDFTLRATPEHTVTLSEFQGRPVVLAFYPVDWGPICQEEMTQFDAALCAIEQYGGVLLGISVDSVWSHQEFATRLNLRFPLLADFEPKGEVARAYGVYRAEEGTSERALFVIDADGALRWRYVSPPGTNPGIQGVLSTLEWLPHSIDSADRPRMHG